MAILRYFAAILSVLFQVAGTRPPEADVAVLRFLLAMTSFARRRLKAGKIKGDQIKTTNALIERRAEENQGFLSGPYPQDWSSP